MANQQNPNPNNPNPPAQQIVLQNNGGAVGVFKPGQFDGNISVAQQWIRTFERYAALANMANPAKCNAFGLLMAESAELWYNGLTDAVRLAWDQLRQAYMDKWINAGHIAVQKQLDTMTCRQGPSESINSFVTRLRGKMDELHYEDQLQLSFIIQGLRPEFKAYAVMGLPYEDVDALQNKLSNCELSFKVNFDSTPTPAAAAVRDSDERIQSIHHKLDVLAKKVEDLQLRPTAERNNERKETFSPRYAPRQYTFRPGSTTGRPPLRCFLCNSSQHLQRECSRRVWQRPKPMFGRFGSRNPASRSFPSRQAGNDRRL